VSEDGGANWSTAYTFAISGADTVTVTKGSNFAADNLVQFRFAYGGPVDSFAVGQANRTTAYANENTALEAFLYESRADAAPSNGGGIVQGVPLAPTFAVLAA
jgi:hypothetical protein